MINRTNARKKRHWRIRKKVNGSAERPRLNIFRSNNSLYAQIIDDFSQTTLVGLSSITLKDLKSKKNIQAAQALGAAIASKAKEQKITDVVFDRGGNLYHGKVKAFAEAVQANGLNFKVKKEAD